MSMLFSLYLGEIDVYCFNYYARSYRLVGESDKISRNVFFCVKLISLSSSSLASGIGRLVVFMGSAFEVRLFASFSIF